MKKGVKYTEKDMQKYRYVENVPLKKTNRSTSILLGVCLTISYSLMVGMIKSDGVYFLPLQQELQASAAKVSTFNGLLIGIIFIAGPLFGATYKIIGARNSIIIGTSLFAIGTIGASLSPNYISVLLCFSVIRGFGTGLAYLSMYTITGKAYVVNQSLMNNILHATSASFAAILAIVMQKGFEMFTWRGVMLIQGAVVMNSLPTGWLATRFYSKLSKEETTSEFQQEKFSCENLKSILLQSFDLNLLKDVSFLIYCIGNSTSQAVLVLQDVFIVRYAQSIGISDEASSHFIPVYQSTVIITCLLVGYVMSKISEHAGNTGHTIVKTSTVIGVTSILQAVIVFIPLIWETYTGYFVYTALAGVLTGCTGKLPVSIVAELFGTKRLASALGFRGLFYGVTMFIVPPAVGKMIDTAGNYKPVLYTTVALSIFGGSLFFLLQILVDRKHQNNKDGKE